jgi:hypothetical protein
MMPLNMSPDGTTMQQADERLIVRFFLKEELNESKSEIAGMSKYDNIEMVEILIPGCRDNCIRKASDQDKHRFKRQYDAFLSTKEDRDTGTPLSHFPFISPAEVKELEYCNVYTGEALVGLQDIYIERIPMDVRPLIKRVKAFMDVAKDSAVAVKYAAENEALRSEMDLMKKQMAQLLEIKHEMPLEKEVVKKRGRQKVIKENNSHVSH